jgi:hypothetical protein
MFRHWGVTLRGLGGPQNVSLQERRGFLRRQSMRSSSHYYTVTPIQRSRCMACPLLVMIQVPVSPPFRLTFRSHPDIYSSRLMSQLSWPPSFPPCVRLDRPLRGRLLYLLRLGSSLLLLSRLRRSFRRSFELLRNRGVLLRFGQLY